MAEEKTVETVSKADYDILYQNYNRLVAAYNKAMSIIGNNYIEKLSQSIFQEVDREEKGEK